MYRFILSLALFLLVVNCDKVGEIIDSNSYEAPIIESLTFSQTNVLPFDTVMVQVKAKNPEKGDLKYSWNCLKDGKTVNEAFIQPASEEKAYWIAPLKGGNYTIRAVVENDKKTTKSNTITVQNIDKPLVNIITPQQENYFIPGENINITLTAGHDNGISKVRFYFSNQLVDSLGFAANNQYQFNYIATAADVGKQVIKITAQAKGQAANIGQDIIEINVEGILSKKRK